MTWFAANPTDRTERCLGVGAQNALEQENSIEEAMGQTGRANLIATRMAPFPTELESTQIDGVDTPATYSEKSLLTPGRPMVERPKSLCAKVTLSLKVAPLSGPWAKLADNNIGDER